MSSSPSISRQRVKSSSGEARDDGGRTAAGPDLAGAQVDGDRGGGVGLDRSARPADRPCAPVLCRPG